MCYEFLNILSNPWGNPSLWVSRQLCWTVRVWGNKGDSLFYPFFFKGTVAHSSLKLFVVQLTQRFVIDTWTTNLDASVVRASVGWLSPLEAPAADKKHKYDVYIQPIWFSHDSLKWLYNHRWNWKGLWETYTSFHKWLGRRSLKPWPKPWMVWIQHFAWRGQRRVRPGEAKLQVHVQYGQPPATPG